MKQEQEINLKYNQEENEIDEKIDKALKTKVSLNQDDL
jgi:hypothetical protein